MWCVQDCVNIVVRLLVVALSVAARRAHHCYFTHSNALDCFLLLEPFREPVPWKELGRFCELSLSVKSRWNYRWIRKITNARFKSLAP